MTKLNVLIEQIIEESARLIGIKSLQTCNHIELLETDGIKWIVDVDGKQYDVIVATESEMNVIVNKAVEDDLITLSPVWILSHINRPKIICETPLVKYASPCPICYDDTENYLECGHTTCKSCLAKIKPICSLCYAPIKTLDYTVGDVLELQQNDIDYLRSIVQFEGLRDEILAEDDLEDVVGYDVHNQVGDLSFLIRNRIL